MTPWFLETMIATTAIMIVVLILRVPVARLLGARAVYLLWAAPALRMILPPLPQSWFGSPILPGGADTSAVFVGAAPLLQIGTAGDSPAVDWIFILLALWLSGAAIFFGTHMMRYRRFKRAVMAEAEPLHSEGRIPVSTSNLISSPIALGIFGRAVVVPADFAERFDRIEQRLALHHEVTHHQRGDLPVNLCALAILSLHWFNPIAHFAHRAFRLDQEAACDAIVLSGADADERHASVRRLRDGHDGDAQGQVARNPRTISAARATDHWILAWPCCDRQQPVADCVNRTRVA
jgi:bla regulator protein blaR1